MSAISHRAPAASTHGPEARPAPPRSRHPHGFGYVSGHIAVVPALTLVACPLAAMLRTLGRWRDCGGRAVSPDPQDS